MRFVHNISQYEFRWIVALFFLALILSGAVLYTQLQNLVSLTLVGPSS